MTKYVRPSLAFPAGRTLVEYDRVHRSCYIDQRIFEEELKNIFYKTWIYAAHEFRIPQARRLRRFHAWSAVNACWCGVRKARSTSCTIDAPIGGPCSAMNVRANTGGLFTCSYHAWQFGLDGKLAAFPRRTAITDTRPSKAIPQRT